MPYTMSLGSEHPGYIVILIDQSGSMCSSFGGSVGGSKAEECAKAVNRVLREIGFACTVGTNVKNRVDISVISYGKSGSNAINAFAGSLMVLVDWLRSMISSPFGLSLLRLVVHQ